MRRPALLLLALLTAAPAGAGPIFNFAGRGAGDGTTGPNIIVDPFHLCVNPVGETVIADYSRNSIRVMDELGFARTLARFFGANDKPIGVACAPDGRVYATTQSKLLFEIETDGTFRALPTTGLSMVHGLAVGPGFLWGTDIDGHAVARWPLPCGAGCAPQIVIAGSPRRLQRPSAVTIVAGVPYVAVMDQNRVVRIDGVGAFTTIAGPATGTCDGGGSCTADASCPAGKFCRFTAGFDGDGGPATAALFKAPQAINSGQDGRLYVADSGNNRVREITIGGAVRTVMGNGTLIPGGAPVPPSSGAPDATQWSVGLPRGVAVDGTGLLRASSPALVDAMIYSTQLSAAPVATATGTATRTASATVTAPPATLTATRTATATPVPPTMTATRTKRPCRSPEPTSTPDTDCDNTQEM